MIKQHSGWMWPGLVFVRRQDNLVIPRSQHIVEQSNHYQGCFVAPYWTTNWTITLLCSSSMLFDATMMFASAMSTCDSNSAQLYKTTWILQWKVHHLFWVHHRIPKLTVTSALLMMYLFVNNGLKIWYLTDVDALWINYCCAG